MTLDEQLDLINYCCNGCILIPLVVGFVVWQRMPANAKVIWWMLLSLMAWELLANWLRWHQQRNHFVYYLRMLTVLGGITRFYTRILPCPKLQWGIAVLLCCGMFAEIVWLVGFNHINTRTLTSSYFLTAFYAFRGLQGLFNAPVTVSFARMATIFYHSGLFLFGFASMVCIPLKAYFIETALDLYYFFDTLWVLLDATAFVLIGVGFWQERNPYSISLTYP